MIKCLALIFLMAMTAASHLPGARQRLDDALIRVGLDSDAPAPSASPTPTTDNAATDNAAPNDAASCDGVTFTRNLKYGDHQLNVLDVATAQTAGAKRPVIVFVAGDSFSSDGKTSVASPLVEQAMCFAGHNGLVAFSMSYRLAPAAPWPAGARDVAAAISWVHENADLFGGNKDEIIPVGYAAGAFHLASFLAHSEFQESDSRIAGAVLVSGIYRPDSDPSEGEKSYFGSDTSKYDGESALSGLTKIDVPLVVAWSSADAKRFIVQGEKLKDILCGAGHCPRSALLSKASSPASVFDLDGTSADLHDRLRQLIGQIDARGLP
ncbi:MAG TPA: alpha/beta hydrolase fold domain-containing protein [Bradyrhizobium sp.]|jgi:acetyl esterase/lipase|nr:alpha/beta hydrolase fold domain-containing protein [Bradyrhizobium sp.]